MYLYPYTSLHAVHCVVCTALPLQALQCPVVGRCAVKTCMQDSGKAMCRRPLAARGGPAAPLHPPAIIIIVTGMETICLGAAHRGLYSVGSYHSQRGPIKARQGKNAAERM